MINTTWLRTFCTLVELEHFTRTAEQLYMTQSGVSQHIRKLEAQVGTGLLIREGKQFSLTDAGKRLYQQAPDVLLALENLAQSVRVDSPYIGEVKVMSPGSIGLKLYPALIELQQQHTELTIDHRFAPNQDIERAILDNRVDIGLMTASSAQPNIDSELIGEDTLVLVTPAKLCNPTWEKLQQLGFIDHPDGGHHASLLLSQNFAEFQRIEGIKKSGFCNQISLIAEPVSRGLGFTVLPSQALAGYANQHKISLHTLAHPVSEPLYLCTKRMASLPRRVETVRKMITALLTKSA